MSMNSASVLSRVAASSCFFDGPLGRGGGGGTTGAGVVATAEKDVPGTAASDVDVDASVLAAGAGAEDDTTDVEEGAMAAGEPGGAGEGVEVDAIEAGAEIEASGVFVGGGGFMVGGKVAVKGDSRADVTRVNERPMT